MPIKVPCRFPGCPHLLDRSGFCSVHKKHQHKARQDSDKRRKLDKDSSFAFEFRSSALWKRLRKVKISMNPICEDPFGDHKRKGTTGNADQVHHIRSIRDAPDLRSEISNLMSVCTRCHAKFNMIERQNEEE